MSKITNGLHTFSLQDSHFYLYTFTKQHQPFPNVLISLPDFCRFQYAAELCIVYSALFCWCIKLFYHFHWRWKCALNSMHSKCYEILNAQQHKTRVQLITVLERECFEMFCFRIWFRFFPVVSTVSTVKCQNAIW